MFGRKSDDCTVPVVVTTGIMMSGHVSTSQPGPACGKTIVSGAAPCGIAVKLVSSRTIATGGSPVPVARNVASTHGSVDATSVLLPPLLGQPLPNGVELAGHVVVRRAMKGDGRPPAARK